MEYHIYDGSFVAERTQSDRTVVSDPVTFTVWPDGKTALFARRGIKLPMGDVVHVSDKVTILVGECDGVRCYVTERDGHIHVFLGRRDLKP